MTTGTDPVTGTPDLRETRGRRIAVFGTIIAVIAVHGVNVRYRFFYDDYFWLDNKPADAGAVFRWFVPPSGSGIYRPLLHAWFQGMRPVFGSDPLPYHLIALAAMVAAALSVRWLALELGLPNLSATVAGVVVGTHVALAPGTLWSSDVQTPVMLALVACAMATAFRWEGTGAQVAAGVLLVLAIMSRDVAVMTPVIAAVLFAAAAATGPRVRPALMATASLWAVSAVYGILRLASGAFGGSDTDTPYRMTIGSHIPSNLRVLMKFTARFGIFRFDGGLERVLQQTWHYVFWATLIGLALWAARRRSYLPIAGVASFFIGTVPVIGIANKPLSSYYVDLGLVGVAVAVGALTQTFRIRSSLVITGLVLFVIAQIGLMQVYESRSEYRAFAQRADALEAYSKRTEARDGVLVVTRACPNDEKWWGKELFRVIRDDPDLVVRFEPRSADALGGCPTP